MDLTKAIYDEKIKQDVCTIVSNIDFDSFYENKRKVEFHNYLGSASRFLDNIRINGILLSDTELI